MIPKPASRPTSSSPPTSSGPTLAGASYGPADREQHQVANSPSPIRAGIGTRAEPSSGLKAERPEHPHRRQHVEGHVGGREGGELLTGKMGWRLGT